MVIVLFFMRMRYTFVVVDNMETMTQGFYPLARSLILRRESGKKYPICTIQDQVQHPFSMVSIFMFSEDTLEEVREVG